jgi:hypothetical protein
MLYNHLDELDRELRSRFPCRRDDGLGLRIHVCLATNTSSWEMEKVCAKEQKPL